MKKTSALCSFVCLMAAASAHAGSDIACAQAAMQAVKAIDSLGWGSNHNKSDYSLYFSSKDDLGAETFYIKSKISGFAYEINMRQAAKSEACYVTSLNNEAEQDAPGSGH